jgi:hypothetical protein
VHVTIKYCKPCGLRLPAERIASRLSEENKVRCSLVAGNFGVFKIWVDDRLVFDKRQTNGWLGKLGFGKLPPEDELVAWIQQKLHFRQPEKFTGTAAGIR